MTPFPRRLRTILLSGIAAMAMIAAFPAQAKTLQSALVDTYNTNPQILAERARLRATDEELSQANAGWRPKVTINGSATWSEDFNNSALSSGETTGWSANVTASQTLFEGGRIGAQREIARAQIRAGRASLRGVESQILLAAVFAYMDVVRDTAVLELSQRQVEVLERERQASQDRFDVGEITRTDVAQAEARLSGARTALTQSEAQLEASRSSYLRVIGSAPQDLEGRPAMPRLPKSFEEAVESAMAINPSLVAAREQALAARSGVDLAVSGLMPNVNLQAQYSRGERNNDNPLFNNNDTDSASVGIGATIPLYQGGSEYSDIRQAKQTYSQSRLLATQAEREAVEAVKNAWEGLAATRDAIKSAQDQVRANEIAYEGVRQEAEVGARTTLDVLNAEQELLNSRVTLVTNERNEYVAAYGLLAAMGRLSATDLSLPVTVYDPVPHADDVAGKLIGVGAE
jgi:outer membrane protein